jgi:hypothetical protein
MHCREDDRNWPEPDRIGKQELEIVMNNEHISFTVRCALHSKRRADIKNKEKKKKR